MTYLMEHADEGLRLELKTDPDIVKRQAAWAGIRPGMRVLDIGCGAGITTAALADLVGPNGHATGLDFSEERLQFARKNYGGRNVDFVLHDIRKPFRGNPPYDAIWVRFLLEYFLKEQQEIVANCVAALKVNGIACLADSDNNSLAHYGPNYSDRLDRTLKDIMTRLGENFNFDPYAGRRLYGHLETLGFTNLNCMVEPHHLIYGDLSEKDAYNWTRKLELTALKSGCKFDEYTGEEFSGYKNPYEAFMADFRNHMSHPGRFSYTPIMICRGERTLRAVR